MDCVSHTALPLVNTVDLTERENITYYEHMREEKHILAHYYSQNLSFLSQYTRLVISLSRRCPLVYIPI